VFFPLLKFDNLANGGYREPLPVILAYLKLVHEHEFWSQHVQVLKDKKFTFGIFIDGSDDGDFPLTLVCIHLLNMVEYSQNPAMSVVLACGNWGEKKAETNVAIKFLCSKFVDLESSPISLQYLCPQKNKIKTIGVCIGHRYEADRSKRYDLRNQSLNGNYSISLKTTISRPELGKINPQYKPRKNRKIEGEKAAKIKAEVEDQYKGYSTHYIDAIFQHRISEELLDSPQQKGTPVLDDVDNDQEEPVHLYINTVVVLLKILINEMQTRSNNADLLITLISKLQQENLKALGKAVKNVFIDKDPNADISIIGRQSIILGRCFAKLVDLLDNIHETKREKLNRYVIHLMGMSLRDMAVIWSKFKYTDPEKEIKTLEENGRIIYNLLSLFYDSQWITGVMWALVEIGTEAKEIYDQLGIGLGVLSGQHGDHMVGITKTALNSATNHSFDDKFRQFLVQRDIETFWLPKAFSMTYYKKKANLHRYDPSPDTCHCGLTYSGNTCKVCDTQMFKDLLQTAITGTFQGMLLPAEWPELTTQDSTITGTYTSFSY